MTPRVFGRLTSLAPAPRPGTPTFRALTTVSGGHVRLYRLTGGRAGGSFDGAPVLLLHHVGRRTGEDRVTPVLFLEDGDDLVVVASLGGSARHPAWYHNLLARPQTEVEVGRERRSVRAEVAGPEDKARLWPRLVALYPAFAAYQRRTERDIPVVVLRPR